MSLYMVMLQAFCQAYLCADAGARDPHSDAEQTAAETPQPVVIEGGTASGQVR